MPAEGDADAPDHHRDSLDDLKRLQTAWFRCFLADDGDACALFVGGESCGICGDPGWAELESKNMPMP